MENIKMKKLVLVLLSLLCVITVGSLVNCGGGGGGSTPAPGPAASVDYKRTEISAFRTNADYIFAHGNNSIADYKRIKVDEFRANGDYIFIHGNASPDSQTLYVALNETSAGAGGTTAGMTGEFTGYLLKMSDVTGGRVTAASATVSHKVSGMTAAGGTIAFRSSFTPDGTKIVQAGSDRVVVLDAATLLPLNGASGDVNIGGGSASFQNHDALAIDNNYAVLALQSHLTSTTDSGVAAFVLYDLNANAAVGAAANACTPCHDSTSGKNHFMCGIDGKLAYAAGVYTGTIYVATTSGGHIAKVPVTITPANTSNPIVVGTATRTQISNATGTATDMPAFHDVRYDSAANKVFYSAIKVDTTATATAGRAHMGYLDLADNTVHDGSIDATAAAQTGLVYCGSGQTADYYIPMTMSYPAYIDVIKKTSVKTGAALSSTPATLYVSVNETTAGAGGTTGGMTGEFTGYLLKMSDIVAGTVTPSSIVASNKVTGMTAAGGTIAFRSSFTPDGTKIVQAGSDRVVVLDAATLLPLNGASGDVNIGGGSASFQNHDALAIDNNYAVLALQSHLTSTTDSGVAAFVLYDLNANAAVGAAANACTPCHDSTSGKNHFMCGIDGKLVKSAAGVYTGTIYVATTSGGHIAKVPVTITPSNTANPIVVGTATMKQVTPTGPPADTTMPAFHDVRYDIAANKVFYSAIKTDASAGAAAGRAHMGYLDLSNDTVHDGSIGATAAAQAGLVYCGSGQTADYFIPMTMSYPAYIDAVKKSAISTGAVIN